MDREIKFRVWESTSKRMGMVTEIHFGDRPFIRADFHGKETGEERLLRSVFGVKKKHTILQFTGVEDENGKEIYDGDIVLNHTKSIERNGVVKYSDIHHAYIIDYKRKKDKRDNWLFMHGTEHNLEVIGNIYENPELLT